MKKRVLSVFLCFVLLISIMANFSVNVYASYDNFNSKLNTIQNEYPNGSISSWQAPSGWYECWAYANQVSYEVFGSYGYTWDHHQDRSEIYPGDLIRYAGYYGTGHTIFVTGVDGDTIYYTDRNGTSTYNMVRWGASINRWNISFISGDKGRQGIYHAPNWDSVVGEPSVPQGSEMTSGYDRILPDGDYIIVNVGTKDKGSYYYLDVQGSKSPPDNETNVHLWGPTTDISSYDVWTISYSNGFYSIKQKGTNMALDVYEFSRSQGANVQVYSANSTSAQKWAISHNDRNGYRIQAKCSGMSLDVNGGGTVAGTNIQQWTNNDSDAQSWLFIPYNPAQPIANGRYVISSAFANNKVISTELTDDIQNIIVSSKGENIGDSVFEITKLDNGYYKVIHCNSGKALTVAGGVSTLGTNVALSVDNNTIAKQWAIIAYNGKYKMISRCNGYALDLMLEGTNITVYRRHTNSNQQWSFEPAEVTVKFDANGGSSVSSVKVTYGNNLSVLPQTSRSGYTFLGWYTSKMGGSKLTTSTKITSNITYYAHWHDLQENSEPSNEPSQEPSVEPWEPSDPNETLIYRFTFENGGDTILKARTFNKSQEVTLTSNVGKIVEWPEGSGNHVLKYELNSVTHTGAGVHPYIWPEGIDEILAAQGDLAPGETYNLTIDIACDGNTSGSYMYPFMLCNAKFDDENYFDKSSFVLSGSLQTHTWTLSKFEAAYPMAGEASGGIALVDELSLENGCNIYIDNVTLTKIGSWKDLPADAGVTYHDGTPAEDQLKVASSLPKSSEESSNEPSVKPSNPSNVVNDTVAGDANGDNSVDMKDVLLIRKHIASLGDSIDVVASDVDNDGSVNMKDVLMIRKFIARLINKLG